MTATVLAPPGTPRPEWLQLRRQGIGGSDAAAICGLDPRRSPMAVYYEKIGELPPDAGSEAAEWGLLLEETVAAEFARRTGWQVRPSPGTLASGERPWQIATPDRMLMTRRDAETGILGIDALLEIKTRSAWVADQWADGVPDGPALQVQHTLDVVGLDRAYVAVLIGGQQLRHYEVTRDDTLIASLRAVEEDFWQRVQDRRPPPVDASEATADLLARLYEVQPESVIDLDPDVVRELTRDHATAKRELAAADAELRGVENRAKALLGEHEIGRAGGQVVLTWKANGTFAVKRFREQYPDLAAQYAREVTDIDMERLKTEQPELYGRFRARRLLIKGGTTDA